MNNSSITLPNGLNEKKIINKISPKKDIDCLTYINQGKLYSGEGEIILVRQNQY